MFGQERGPGFGVCHNPKLLREGSAVCDFRVPAKTVIGQIDSHSGESLGELYRSLTAPLITTSLECAEMIKYVDNSWHALKVGFANEIGILCKARSIDSHELMKIFCSDHKLNISEAYLSPGFAFGGSCLARYIRECGRDDGHFVCTGGGPKLETLKRRSRDIGVDDCVEFTGRISDAELLEILSTADNPDRPSEMTNISTMIKIMEYMALSKPIVQFEVKEGRRSAGEASLYADPANMIPDFARKIPTLLDHPEERKRMGEIGRQRVENGLAWSFSVRNLLAAYERALPRVCVGSIPAKQSDETGG